MVKLFALSFIVFFFIVHQSITAQGFVDFGRTTQANIDMTLNNLGIIGNSFRGVYSSNGWGSCEYPAGSNIEHLFNGGLWVGGIINGRKTVTTGAVGTSQGYVTGGRGYEFTAEIGSKLIQKSNLLDDPNYDPSAVSHQDFIGNFTDKNIIVPGSNNQAIIDHTTPLFVNVRFEAYNWNFSSANFFVPLVFEITNGGTETIDSLWLGYWVNFVIRDVSVYTPVGTPFFSSAGNAYIDSLRLAYQFDAENINFNSSSYAALKYLGAEDKKGPRIVGKDGFRVNFNTWFFNSDQPNFFTPRSDLEYFSRLTTGMNFRSDWNTLQAFMLNKGNRTILLSAGPFGSLAPGEKVKITYAIICASSVRDGNPPYQNTPAQRAELLRNAISAQLSFNGEDKNENGVLDLGEDTNNNGRLDRWIFPEPPAIPIYKVLPGDGYIDIFWTDKSVLSVDPVSRKKDFEGFRIYKTQLAFDMQSKSDLESNLKLVASFDKKGNGLFFDNGFDSIRLETPIIFDGDSNVYTFKYRFKNVVNGWQHAISLTAFDAGDDSLQLPSLESSLLSNVRRVFAGKPANGSLRSNTPFVYPNPYFGLAAWEGRSRFEEDRKIIFSNLPADCVIKIYNPAGDLIRQLRHDPSYSGATAKWFNTYSNPTQTVFSGGEHVWDLMTEDQQLLARGIYLFSVEDLKTGESFPGKFVVVK